MPPLSRPQRGRMDHESTLVRDASKAARARNALALQRAINRCVRHTSTVEAQRWFRESVPMKLKPDELIWLLREITDDAGFERRRDEMLDALTNDLIKNGYRPGRDFSSSPDNESGRKIILPQHVWNIVRKNISSRSAQFYRAFVSISPEQSELKGGQLELQFD